MWMRGRSGLVRLVGLNRRQQLDAPWLLRRQRIGYSTVKEEMVDKRYK